MATFLQKKPCMFPVVSIYIYIEYIFPYREYNTASKKSKLVCNFYIYCITWFVLEEENAKLMEFATKKKKKSVWRGALNEEVKKCVFSKTQAVGSLGT